MEKNADFEKYYENCLIDAFEILIKNYGFRFQQMELEESVISVSLFKQNFDNNNYATVISHIDFACGLLNQDGFKVSKKLPNAPANSRLTYNGVRGAKYSLSNNTFVASFELRLK